MANLYGNTTRQFSTPYLTIDEFKQAPTSIDYDNLVVASTDPAIQNAELNNVIARASSWMDTYCYQVLGATVETENQRARLRNNGILAIHPRYFPLVALLSLSYGTDPNGLTQYPDPSQGWIEDEQFLVPYSSANLSYSSQGPLQFGMPAIPRAEVYCRYQYISGYPSTLLNASALAGATSITVKDATGIIAGTQMTIYDGSNTENVTVSSSYVFGTTVVPLTVPLAYAHSSGVSVSALPPAIKEAAILATTAFLKVRGDNSLTMAVGNQPNQPASEEVTRQLASDLALAKEMLRPFRRVR
jgi:hypothetical protein